MATLESGAQKTTILELANRLGAQLADLKARLDSRFNRLEPSKVELKDADCPSHINVLDEIADNLEHSIRSLDGTIEYISSEVLPKISG